MSGAYKNSEYFTRRAQQDQKRKAKERLETLLLEGINSQGQEATPEWEQRDFVNFNPNTAIANKKNKYYFIK